MPSLGINRLAESRTRTLEPWSFPPIPVHNGGIDGPAWTRLLLVAVATAPTPSLRSSTDNPLAAFVVWLAETWTDLSRQPPCSAPDHWPRSGTVQKHLAIVT